MDERGRGEPGDRRAASDGWQRAAGAGSSGRRQASSLDDQRQGLDGDGWPFTAMAFLKDHRHLIAGPQAVQIVANVQLVHTPPGGMV